jgi:hypothetical protein
VSIIDIQVLTFSGSLGPGGLSKLAGIGSVSNVQKRWRPVKPKTNSAAFGAAQGVCFSVRVFLFTWVFSLFYFRRTCNVEESVVR